MSAFGRLVKKLKPDLVTMEKVPQLADHPVFEQLLRSLAGYKKWRAVVECTSIGIPQTRKRLVLLASRLGGKDLALAKNATQDSTVRQVIGALPAIRAGESHPHDELHMASSLSALNLARIKASRPGGTWRSIGNAVPVRLGEVIAKSLVTHVQAYANSAIPR